MKTNLTPLKHWMADNCGSEPTLKQKEDAAFLLGVGIATIYRWIKEGNRYIEETGCDESGEMGPVFIWKMEKEVQA